MSDQDSTNLEQYQRRNDSMVQGPTLIGSSSKPLNDRFVGTLDIGILPLLQVASDSQELL